jgi:outer membrane immunogenic protein
MKKTLTTAALMTGAMFGALVAGSAMAADMKPAPVFTKAPMMAPVFSWTGFYIGGHAGCAWGNDPSVTAFGTTDAADVFTHSTEKASGCFSGGQIGADYQFAGGFVVGILGDISFGKISSFNQSIEDATSLVAEATSWESKLTSFGTARGRLGYAITGGLPVLGGLSWMPYVTGGWAWGRNKVSVQGDAGTFTSDTQSLSGWTFGAGIEYAITSSLTWKGEYLYTRYNSATYAVILDDELGVPPVLTLDRMTVNSFKTGLNWRLGMLGM